VVKEVRKAVTYLRTSSATNVSGDKDSEKRQRAVIEAYAEAAGYEIVGEFYDAAVSGDADPIDDRPGFTEMLARLMRNGARTILVESPDHFARDFIVQLAGHDMLKAKGSPSLRRRPPRSSSAIRPASSAIRPALFGPAAQAPGPVRDPNLCIEQVGWQGGKRVLRREFARRHEAEHGAAGERRRDLRISAQILARARLWNIFAVRARVMVPQAHRFGGVTQDLLDSAAGRRAARQVGNDGAEGAGLAVNQRGIESHSILPSRGLGDGSGHAGRTTSDGAE
jgi:Resolvase, N terminal domain